MQTTESSVHSDTGLVTEAECVEVNQPDASLTDYVGDRLRPLVSDALKLVAVTGIIAVLEHLGDRGDRLGHKALRTAARHIR